jgi:SAM-dependent methyltransferase
VAADSLRGLESESRVPSYPDLPNPDLLDRIPLEARVVLDVGCGSGALAAAYRPLNPRACLFGIEQDADAAALAADRMDAVATLDVEQTPLPFALPGGIDCLIYGDVLEHLKDPWAVLRRQVEALSEAGTVLICVPNVEHWSFAARLLKGTWDYEPNGLFDETHLRWFSLNSMRRGLEALGLALCDVHPRVFDAERANAFVNAMSPTLRQLGIDPQEYTTRAAPLQFVWRARKRPVAPMTIVSTMLAPVGGVSHVRVVYPLRALATDPSVRTRIVETAEQANAPASLPRIFMLHRLALGGLRGAEFLSRLLAAGWLIVTEFDDHPDFFRRPADSGEALAFKAVHAVQTSTPALAEVLGERNSEVRVFPNAMRALPEVRNFANPDRLTLFFGALNRERDWASLMPALNAVAEAVGARLQFSVVHDRAFFDALRSPYKQFTPTCDHGTYLRLLGEAEISLMPLADTEFNRAKSDLKFVEAGACRVAPLASHVVYAQSIEDGRTGVLFRDGDELGDRLRRLLAVPELARSLGDAARAHVADKRMLAYQVADRIAWYRSLWERRAELTEALIARVDDPALAQVLRAGASAAAG